jgi:hypothetical protein
MTTKFIAVTLLALCACLATAADANRVEVWNELTTLDVAQPVALDAGRLGVGRRPSPRSHVEVSGIVPRNEERAGSAERPSPTDPALNEGSDRVRMTSSQSYSGGEMVAADAGGASSAFDPRALLTFPEPDSTLSRTQAFRWTRPDGVEWFWLWAGTCEYCGDLADVDAGRSTEVRVNLPADGRLIYVTLFTWYADGWYWREYVFRASGGSAEPAQMLSPRNGERLARSQRFTWSEGSNVSSYHLYIGSCKGCADILDEGQGRNLSRTIDIPGNGRTVYVTLFSHIYGDWYWYEHEYQASTSDDDGGGRDVSIEITNHLIYDINFSVNDRIVGSVPAGQTRTAAVTVDSLSMSYEVVQPTLSGRTLGDRMAGTYNTITNPASRYEIKINNRIGEQWFFAPLVANRTSAGLLMEVNGGYSAQNRCNCVVGTGQENVAFGYYRFYNNSNVRGYRDGSNYSGRYLFWGIDPDGRGSTLNLQTDSGVARLTANSAP